MSPFPRTAESSRQRVAVRGRASGGGCACATLIGILLTVGCQTLDLTAVDPANAAPEQITPAGASAAAEAPGESDSATVPISDESGSTATTPSLPTVDPHLVSTYRKWLDQDAWQLDVGWTVLSDDGVCPSRPWRWTFIAASSHPEKGLSTKLPPGAERWNAVWQGTPEQLSEADHGAAASALTQLRSDTDRVGNNAAILLARLRRQSVSPQDLQLLEQLSAGNVGGADSESPAEAGPRSVALAVRCAAAETWCRCLSATSGARDVVLAPAGKLLTLPGIAEELQGTLWRTLARDIAPDRLPGLAAALAPSANTRKSPGRLAALEACVIAAASRREGGDAASPYEFIDTDWPTGLMGLRLAAEPINRRLVGRWAAWSQHPEALTLLTSQGRDIDPEVQAAAIRGLGLLQTAEALKVLHHLARQPQEPRQAVAVAAIGRWGASELESYAVSPSADVRSAVARGLAPSADSHSRKLLRQLLSDTDLAVQAAALATANQWPREDAVPLLLLAVEDGAFATRKSAQQLLSEHLDEPPLLPIEGTQIERRDAVRIWAATHGYVLEPWQPRSSEQTAATLSLAGEGTNEQQELRNLLEAFFAPDAPAAAQTETLEHLQRIASAADVPLIEQLLMRGSGPAARRLQEELLPKISPVYAALRELGSPELQRRRDAARRIQLDAAQRPLSPGMLGIMAEVLVREQDHLVWQACLAAVADDGHDAANRLALLALNHVWPDLRRLGAEHFRRHPAPESVPALLPLLHDSHQQVQLAAVAALQASGSPVAIEGLSGDGSNTRPVAGLRRLMTSGDDEVRWATLTALAALGDEVAAVELQRLMQDPLPQVRARAVQAMGNSGQVRFVDPLLRHSWTEANDSVKRTLIAGVESLIPVGEHPDCHAGLVARASIDDKIHCWVSWWDLRRPQRQTARGRRDDMEGSR